MIRLKTLLEKSVKADFLKAIGNHKPVVSYRVHADIGDDKVGITGWYTIAVIHDVIDDIKKTGVKILGIEKSTDLKKLHKNIDGIRIENSLKEMIVSDKTDGRVKQMLKKMQGNYPSMNAINYNTQDKTYLFAFEKKSDAEKLEKDFSTAKSKKGKMKLVRSAEYPNDKPPVFVKQYKVMDEAWLKPASPLLEKKRK